MKLPRKFAFVDVETSGPTPTRDRIIEIGIIRVEDGKVVETLDTLINPQTHVPPEIEYLTGIESNDLISAPTFDEVIGKVKELLTDCVFVAHNARFDYAFIKNEFRRYDQKLRCKTLCTVKLFRKLFPDIARHNLDSVIENFQIKCDKRHRAFSDAFVLWEFYKKLREKFEEEELNQAINIIMKRSTIPTHLTRGDLDNITEGPGVYIFHGEDAVLYIGKSVNVYNRVKSHFVSDYQTATDIKITRDIRKIEVIPTAGEMGALLRESDLIKKIEPLYNRVLRRRRGMIALVKNENENRYFTTSLIDVNLIPPQSLHNVLGIFKSAKDAKETLRIIAKERKLCLKLLGLDKGTGPCFATQIDQCKGACIGKENSLFYNVRFLESFAHSKISKWPHKDAIIIKEEHEDLKEFHLINNWCYVGSTSDPSNKDWPSTSIKFDWDVYKIIKKFINKPNILPHTPHVLYNEL